MASSTSKLDESDWRQPILDYLNQGAVPDDKIKARKLRHRAAKYCEIGGTLYKKYFASPLLRCLFKSEVEKVLKDMHEGICGIHKGGKSLAFKIICLGYYWSTLNYDAKIFV